jgi:protein gp37
VLRDSDAYKGLAEVHKGKGGRGKPRWTGEARLCPEELQKPLRRRPRPEGDRDVVFVCDMGDLFHEKVPFEYIAAVFGVMAATPHITYLLLTKRANNLKVFYKWAEEAAVDVDGSGPSGLTVSAFCARSALEQARAQMTSFQYSAACRRLWPLPNVYPGVSVESQDYVHRVEELLRVPAAGRWVSYEPGLGPLDLEAVFSVYDKHGEPSGPRCKPDGSPVLSLVVAGCESGPGRRPFELDWARSLRDQCDEAGVHFYFKQAEVDGRVVAEPFLDGRQHLELPWMP